MTLITMSRKVRVVKYPCGVCGGDCGINTILCATCNKWHHIKCEHITAGDFKFLSGNSTVEYVCARCRSDEEGKFDFAKGLRRLASYIGDSSAMKTAAATEAIYLKKHAASVRTINILVGLMQ